MQTNIAGIEIDMTEQINPKEQEILSNLEADIRTIKKELDETIKAIVDGGYSKFPILLAHEENIAIAQKVIDKKDYHTHFNFSASTMEEMVARKIILDERKADFERRFKTNADKFCVLLVHPESMKFVFAQR